MIPLFEQYCKQSSIDGKTIRAKIGNSSLDLKVASLPKSIELGYSVHGEPQDGEGMLFVFGVDSPLSFWMKGVDFPLDLMFFDSNMKLVNVHSMGPCGNRKDQDLERYQSSRPSAYAVEVPSGWCSKNLDKNNCDLSF
jgi:uncharacterized membrane protein (UPF0127 family)